MNTTNNQLVSRIIALFTLAIIFGCSDVTVDPDVNINGPDFTNYSKAKAYKSFSHSVDLNSQTFLNLEGINGTINIESVSGLNQVLISGEKIVSADTYEDANSHLKDISIEIKQFTNKLLVKTLQPDYSDGKSYSVNYSISIPSPLSVKVKNINGLINGRISVPVNGTIDMSLQNGSIELEIPQNTSADFSANLINGKISVQNLSLKNRVASSKSIKGILSDGQGKITLKTVNGKINVLGF
jgi:hypothetical protein